MNAPNDVYTHGHSDAVLRSHRWRTAANSAAYLLPHLASGQRLLDVGCGPGTISAEFAGIVGAQGRVVGLDRSQSVIDEARRHAADAGVDNIDFVIGDVYALEFPDDTFDVVHAHQVLQHISDPVAALKEMRRVCKPGGLIAARDADYAAMTWFPTNDQMDRWLSVYRAVAFGNHAEPDAGRHLLSWALQAGFADVMASAGVWCYANTDDRAWWSSLWADRITISNLAHQAVAGGHATDDELQEIAAAWRHWGVQPDGWFTVLNGEILARA